MKAKTTKIKIVAAVLFSTALVIISLSAGGGSLEPTAPPGPTMHTLEDIYNVVSAGVEPPQQPFAFDCFLKIDGIEGECNEPMHKGWVELLSYSHGISQPASAERADHQDFSIVKKLDSSSPQLALYCCTGDLIPYIELELCRATGDKEKFMDYKMEDVIITGVMPVAPALVQADSKIEFKNFTLTLTGGETLPLEEVSFNYRKILWEYIMADGNSVATGWDLDTDSPIIPSPD
jgi:type VI secretion system secreted protein Hcp